MAEEEVRAEPIAFTRSTDGGKTWSPAVRLSPSGENRVQGFRQGSIIRTGPDGRACTCPWWSRHPGDRGPCAHLLAVELVASTDDAAPT